jgi:hypothetical protein
MFDEVFACCWQPTQAPKLAICRSGGSKLMMYHVEANMETPINGASFGGESLLVCCDFSCDGSVLAVADANGGFHFLRGQKDSQEWSHSGKTVSPHVNGMKDHRKNS